MGAPPRMDQGQTGLPMKPLPRLITALASALIAAAVGHHAVAQETTTVCGEEMGKLVCKTKAKGDPFAEGLAFGQAIADQSAAAQRRAADDAARRRAAEESQQALSRSVAQGLANSVSNGALSQRNDIELARMQGESLAKVREFAVATAIKAGDCDGAVKLALDQGNVTLAAQAKQLCVPKP